MNIYNNFIELLFEYNLYTISKKIFITYLTLENSSLDCYWYNISVNILI